MKRPPTPDRRQRREIVRRFMAGWSVLGIARWLFKQLNVVSIEQRGQVEDVLRYYMNGRFSIVPGKKGRKR